METIEPSARLPEETPSARRVSSGRLAIVALVVLTSLAYANSLTVPFVFDDLPNLAENPLIRDLGFFVRPGMLEASDATPQQLYGFRARWVAFLTFAVNYRLHGLDFPGYHAVNLAIHLCASLLLFRLARRTLALPIFDGSVTSCGAFWISWFSAALFAVHPIQTQAVTYVVQRMASLAALLCLLALVSYLEARQSSRAIPRWSWYALGVVAIVAAMKTKENAAAFPLVIVLYEALFLRGRRWVRMAWLAPFVLAMAIVPVELAASGDSAQGMLDAAVDSARAGTSMARSDYFFTQTRVVVRYLRLLVLPIDQNLDYDFRVSHSPWEPAVLLSELFLLALLLAAAWLVRDRAGRDPAWKLVGFGVLWFFSTLSVESSFIPIEDVIFEHRLYLPLGGIALAAGTALFAGFPKRTMQLSVLAGAALVLLTAATVLRNQVWQSPLTIWRDAAIKSPNKARPRFNYGDYLRRAGELAAAKREWEAAVVANPRHSEALNGLGNFALADGRLVDAYDLYRRAVESRAGNIEANYNLAVVAERLGRIDEAIRYYGAFVGMARPEHAAHAAAARQRISYLSYLRGR